MELIISRYGIVEPDGVKSKELKIIMLKVEMLPSADLVEEKKLSKHQNVIETR